MRRWSTAFLVVLAVLDVVVLGLGYRARSGSLPPLQNTTTAIVVKTDGAASDPTTAAPTGDIKGPLMLSVNAAGLVLRATRGACQERFDNPARVSVGTIGTDGELTDVQVDGISEVLGLMVYGDGTLRLTGLDAKCEDVTLDSDDEGTSWQSVEEPGLWRLDEDTLATSVTGPGGVPFETPCLPEQMVNLPRKLGIASCDHDSFMELTPSQAKPVALPAPGFSRLSATAGEREGHYYVFGTSAGCIAQVADLEPAEEVSAPLECLGKDRAPLAIAAAGDWVVVQVGHDVEVSSDAGRSFQPLTQDVTS